MANTKQPKIFEFQGEKYRYNPKTRGYISVDNPDKKISRRKYDEITGKLKREGFKSYESKAKFRKSLGLSRARKTRNKQGKAFYRFYGLSLDDIEYILGNLSPGATTLLLAVVESDGEFSYAKKAFGTRSHRKDIFAVSPYSRPGYLLRELNRYVEKFEERFYSSADEGANAVITEFQLTVTF